MSRIIPLFLGLLLALASLGRADHLVVSRSATLKDAPDRDGVVLDRSTREDKLQLLDDGQKTNGYYKVALPGTGQPAFIYKTLVRRHRGDLEPVQPGIDAPGTLSVCSFNVQFVGLSTKRDEQALAEAVQDCDIVVVQEVCSPPFAGTFPDGTAFKPDDESQEFFDAMTALGYEFVLSEEDTGSGEKIHTNSSATEWWVAFYKPEAVAVANDLPVGPEYVIRALWHGHHSVDCSTELAVTPQSRHTPPSGDPPSRAASSAHSAIAVMQAAQNRLPHHVARALNDPPFRRIPIETLMRPRSQALRGRIRLSESTTARPYLAD